jgi:DNA-directed RNA polymerase subunit RPC12/RpoP
MEIERCSKEDCRRPFEVSEFGGQMPGTRESEDITCPYCNHTITRRSNGLFRTHALSPDREAQYNLDHPL